MSLFIRVFCESRDPADTQRRLMALYKHPNTPEHEKKAAAAAHERLFGIHPDDEALGAPRSRKEIHQEIEREIERHRKAYEQKLAETERRKKAYVQQLAARAAALGKHPPKSPEWAEANRKYPNPPSWEDFSD